MNIKKERAAFELYFSSGNPKCPSIERRGDSYKLMQAASDWRIWQVRAMQDSEYVCNACFLQRH